MEEQVITFAADNTGLDNTIIIALLFALAGIGTMLYFLKKAKEGKNLNQNYLIAMLAFFVFTIAGGTAFFSWFTTSYKIIDVVVTEDKITTGEGQSYIKDITKIYFHNDVQRSLINPALQKGSTQFLIIQEVEGKTHALSAENYDVQQIYGLLKKRMNKKE